jgi:predicted nuclease with TOPRIM domain
MIHARILAVLCLPLVAGLVGCGEKQPSAASSTTPTANKADLIKIYEYEKTQYETLNKLHWKIQDEIEKLNKEQVPLIFDLKENGRTNEAATLQKKLDQDKAMLNAAFDKHSAAVSQQKKKMDAAKMAVDAAP